LKQPSPSENSESLIRFRAWFNSELIVIENMQYAAIVLHDVPAGARFLRERTHDLARKGVIAPDLSNVQADPK
jgi:hypothetical protein